MSAATVQIDPAVLQRSHAYCQRLTKRQAKNFYWGLKLLPEPKRSAMYALYAYMRLVDDIADDEADGRTVDQRRAALDHWRKLTHAALTGEMPPDQEMWPAFVEMVQTYQVPAKLFDDMIEGQRQDLAPAPFGTWQDLRTYCYRVASVVGLASIHVWGFSEGSAKERTTRDLAVDRGLAFQLTNILRDFREDIGRGRCYLPAEDFARFGVTPENLRPDAKEFAAFLAFQARRAAELYAQSEPLEQRVSADARPTLRAMTQIYRGILAKIIQQPTVILRRRVKLSPVAKFMIAWRALRTR